MDLWTRRRFFLTSLAASALAGASKLLGKTFFLEKEGSTEFSMGGIPAGKPPVMISSANGVNALGKGMEILKSGGDTLDAEIIKIGRAHV